MLKKINLRSTLISGLIAAILFCILVFFHIRSANYKNSWLLYFGSFLFMIVIWIHTMQDSKKRRNNESTVALVFASHMATLAGIIISCGICLLMLIILVPGYLDQGTAGKILTQAPANTVYDKTHGLSLQIFLSATLINFSVGSFCGIVLPFYLKRNQTRDLKEPTPLHQHGIQ